MIGVEKAPRKYPLLATGSDRVVIEVAHAAHDNTVETPNFVIKNSKDSPPKQCRAVGRLLRACPVRLR